MSKLDVWVALRNTLGLLIPLTFGWIFNWPEGGVGAALGSLVVSYSDGPDPYVFRAKRMTMASFVCVVAVFSGALSAHSGILAVVLSILWAFIAGLLVVLGTTASNFGSASLTLFVIFAAKPVTLQNALLLSGLAFVGGMLQAGLALILWPIRRFAPERHMLGSFYIHLAKMAQAPIFSKKPPLGSDQATQTQLSLASLERGRSYETLRYRSLLTQAERIRMSILALGRLKRRIQREYPQSDERILLRDFLSTVSLFLETVGQVLIAGNEKYFKKSSEFHREITDFVQKMREQKNITEGSFLSAVILDIVYQMESLSGQLRAVEGLTRHTTSQGNLDFYKRESERAWWLRFTGVIATLAANLTLKSSVCRHAIRLAICIGIGELISRSFKLDRSYWLPLTIAVVLKPEFTSTYSRVLLRIFGTVAGLIFATAVFHFFHPPVGTDILLASALMFLLRWVGPANYGVFTFAVSGLVVVLFAITGIEPKEIVFARVMNTVLGGGIGFLAYWLWPSYEAVKFSQELAKMLESYQAYFHEILDICIHNSTLSEHDIDKIRLDARVSRSNLNASIDRLTGESTTIQNQKIILGGIQASSNRFAYSVMALEAGGQQNLSPLQVRSLQIFSEKVDETLLLLRKSIYGDHVTHKQFPNLREYWDEFVQSGGSYEKRYSLIYEETDRLTNSLNTLREQIIVWKQSSDSFLNS
jgi:uncharacterized membrane protein YccC